MTTEETIREAKALAKDLVRIAERAVILADADADAATLAAKANPHNLALAIRSIGARQLAKRAGEALAAAYNAYALYSVTIIEEERI